jgi:hypothetical protein
MSSTPSKASYRHLFGIGGLRVAGRQRPTRRALPTSRSPKRHRLRSTRRRTLRASAASADSPIVEDEVQPFGMVVVGYRF